jgi:hypothetical protein
MIGTDLSPKLVEEGLDVVSVSGDSPAGLFEEGMRIFLATILSILCSQVFFNVFG